MRPKIEKILANYPKLDFVMGGENKDTKESMTRLLRAGVISILSIFVILIVMFTSFGQPLVILATIPLGMIGVILSFKLLVIQHFSILFFLKNLLLITVIQREIRLSIQKNSIK